MLTSEALVCFIQLWISAIPKPDGTVGCKSCGVWIRYSKIERFSAFFRLFLIVGTVYIICQASLQKHSGDISV